jgi:hypothetical protein
LFADRDKCLLTFIGGTMKLWTVYRRDKGSKRWRVYSTPFTPGKTQLSREVLKREGRMRNGHIYRFHKALINNELEKAKQIDAEHLMKNFSDINLLN